MNGKGVYKTALATQGLLMIYMNELKSESKYSKTATATIHFFNSCQAETSNRDIYSPHS